MKEPLSTCNSKETDLREVERCWSPLLAIALPGPRILGDEAEVVVIGQTHFFTFPSHHHHHHLLCLMYLIPILAPPLDRFHFHTPSSPLSHFAFLLCHHAVGVTVGCAASCLLSPCTPWRDRRNYSISCSCCVRGPPASSAEPQEFLSADHSNSAVLQML